MNDKSKRVLIADDDVAILDALRFILEGEGYTVDTIASGDVVSMVINLCPDLLLLDVRMSGRDGREICRELKRSDATKHVPVILMSANHGEAAIATEVGAHAFLDKPFELDDLLSKIQKHTSSV